ncbi:hypothetical protein [Veillonella sp. T11011-6]|uniref:hypothetical protein n=1 Tax=Veillonella sp. T11011-6 TaxID=2027459 RepID=UPI000CF54371|nr:hypothetical protein [Veillonella sp. T11011-6]PQL10228.1 hypothetical protein VRHSUH10_06930 [Veillonella sp. T11011-6]
MKLKSTLLGLAVALAFTMPIDAAQYTVPEGQPPVPGADASIPDTAYQNYRYDKTRNITTADHIKKMEDYNKRIDGEVLKKKGTAEQAEQLKKAYAKYLDLITHESTVILLHEGDYKAKVTLPISVVESYFEDLDKKGKGSYVFDRYAIAGLVGANERVEDSGFNKKAQRQGEFMYTGLSKGYWGIREQYANGNLPVMYAAVTFDKYPNQTYMAFLGNKNQPVTKKLESTMANFVIPSMQTLDNLDKTSDTVTWDNLTYRLPKGMMLDREEKSDNFQGRVYVGDSMKLVVARSALADKAVPIQLYTQTVLKHFFYKKNPILVKDIPLQAALIWNNGVPSYLLEQYNPGKKSRIFQLITDGKYEYYISLTYEDGKNKYNHIELRNIMEYLDFGNAKQLRHTSNKRLKK